MPEAPRPAYPWREPAVPSTPPALLATVNGVLDRATDADLAAVRECTADGGPGPYLDRMEQIVRQAASWRSEVGAIIDPFEGIEHGQTSPRFASPGAILLAHGRCPELADAVYDTMSYSCARLADREAASPDFWMRELGTAYHCLRDVAPADRVAGWAADLRRVVPEATNKYVSPEGDAAKIAAFHNWVVYGAAGEVIRARADLAPADTSICWGDAFFDKYMPAQLDHMTELGMYRDPGDPITYDITTRLQLAAALAYGYDGPLRTAVDERLAGGGLATLLFMSPDGHVPYGGRSAEYHFREAICCALCELEARRYRDQDPRLAGAFKRQAQLARDGIARWLDMQPWRSLKNTFPPEDRFGYDSYGVYSVYSLLCASFMGLAALWADERIAPAPCPADLGGWVLPMAPAFAKVFASVRDSQVQIETHADLHHDANGLGRFTTRGVPLELGLGMAFPAKAKYRLPEPYGQQAAAMGVAWTTPDNDSWQPLAGADATGRPTVLQQTPDLCTWRLLWQLPSGAITEHYSLHAGGRLDYHAAGAGYPRLAVVLPLLLTDGDAESRITREHDRITVRYRGASLSVTLTGANQIELDTGRVANRHGVYQLARASFPASNARVSLQLSID